MYLATLLHESSGLRVTEENHNPTSIAAYGKYIGRGYIQLSSIDNYRAASNFLREDYVSHPEKVSHDPHAWNVSAWYWQDQVHQHVNQGFEATVTYGIRPLEPHFASRKRIYENVCQALHVDQQP
jgi:predicted chitinase